jgi:hypothetical protein
LAEFNRTPNEPRDSKGAVGRYSVVKRLLLACLPVIAYLVIPLAAAADDLPYKTVVDGVVPMTHGLSIAGSQGGCDLLIQNLTGQTVSLQDMNKPPKSLRFPSQKAGSPPVSVQLTGAWPCVNLPAVTEDQRWNNTVVTVQSWSVAGTVGALAFKLNARTVYDPALDPNADLFMYLRIGSGLLVVGGILYSIPFLVRRRREIFATTNKRAA